MYHRSKAALDVSVEDLEVYGGFHFNRKPVDHRMEGAKPENNQVYKVPLHLNK